MASSLYIFFIFICIILSVMGHDTRILFCGGAEQLLGMTETSIGICEPAQGLSERQKP